MTPDPRCSCGHARRTHSVLVLRAGDTITYHDHHGPCRSCGSTVCARFDRVSTPLAPAPPQVPPDLAEAVRMADVEIRATRRVELLQQVIALQLEGAGHQRDAAAACSRAATAQGKIIDLLLDDLRSPTWHPLEST